MRKYLFGIDLGGTTVKCGLFSAEGTVLEKWEINTRTENSGEYILRDIADSVQQKMREHTLKQEDVMGLGIGIPGSVKANGEVMAAVNLHWGHKDVTGELETILGLPVRAANDANIAALGEIWMGGGKGKNSMVMVTLGTGVGGGIIIDGKMLAGAHGAGGEIGHANVNPNVDWACNCGNYGCLEQFASATGIVKIAMEELIVNREKTILDKENLSAKSIFDAYKESDVAAARIVEKFSMYLGNALAFIACIVDPEVFVIGGGVSKAGLVLMDLIVKYYKKSAYKICREIPFVLAELGNDAGIYGGAKLVLDSIGNLK